MHGRRLCVQQVRQCAFTVDAETPSSAGALVAIVDGGLNNVIPAMIVDRLANFVSVSSCARMLTPVCR
jgi:hypothetical protein